jgi:DNA-binding CsgD family transcriptional regulator
MMAPSIRVNTGGFIERHIMAPLPPHIPPAIVICSEHPIAYRMIYESLYVDHSLPFQLEKYDRAKCNSIERPLLLVLDCCSDNYWPEKAIQWSRQGGTIICIFPESPMQYEEQLRAMYLGASAIVCISQELGKELCAAAHAVLEGKVWYQPEVVARYIRRRLHPTTATQALPPSLTIREEQVVSFVIKKFRNKEIAAALNISERTVKYHISHILEKLNISSRSELIVAIKAGIVQTEGAVMRKCG